MKPTPLITTAALLFLFGSPALATSPATAGSLGHEAKAARGEPGKATPAARRATPARTKPVDINSASGKDLKKLPGIGDTEAARIVAGRPYASKSWLVTRNVLSAAEFERLKHLIVARQPYADPARNAALYRTAQKP